MFTLEKYISYHKLYSQDSRSQRVHSSAAPLMEPLNQLINVYFFEGIGINYCSFKGIWGLKMGMFLGLLSVLIDNSSGL